MKRTLFRTVSALIILLIVLSTFSVGLLSVNALYESTTASYCYPIRQISTSGRGFTSTHGGIDLSISRGTNVYSVRNGVVEIVYTGCKNYNGAGSGKDCNACGCTSKKTYMNGSGKGYRSGYYCNGGFGNGVVVKNDDGLYSYYAHLDSVSVKVGDKVTPNTVVGKVGSAGCSTGPHLHFSVSTKASGGTNYDPFKYIFPGFSIVLTNNGASSVNPRLQVNFAWKDFSASKCLISFGTSASSLTKTTSDSNFTAANCFYNLSSKFGNLSKGQTYYFKVSVTKNGTTYQSSVYSFVAGDGNKDFLNYASVKPGPVPPDPDPDPIHASWSGISASNVGKTNAQINATVTFDKNVKHEKCGFYFGTSASNLSKNAKYDTVNVNRATTKMWFDLNKYGKTLTPGTTYYYQFYMIADGKEYKSEVKSFVTVKTVNAKWSGISVSNVGKTNAQINATVTFDKNVKHEKCGFYFGTSASNLSKNAKFDTVNVSRKTTKMWFGLNKYGQTLKAGTTYYYQFYMIADGQEFKSAVMSFTTAK